MGGNNYLLRKQEETRQEAYRVAERITRQFDVDSWQIALARYGKLDLGYQRIMEITELAEQVRAEYAKALTTEKEADVARDHLDKELMEILKGRDLIYFEQRYPELKKITYEGRKKR